MRAGTAKRIARAQVAASDAVDAEPIRSSDRGMVYTAAGATMPMAFDCDIPTMRDLMELSRATTRRNIEALQEIRDAPRTPAVVKVAAIGMLLDRGYGRPHQSIAIADLTTPGKLDLSGFTADELREFEYLLTKATASKPAPRDVTPAQAHGIVPVEDETDKQ